MWVTVIFAETIGSAMRDEREVRWESMKGRDCDEPALAMFRDSVGFEQWPVEKAVRQKRCPALFRLSFTQCSCNRGMHTASWGMTNHLHPCVRILQISISEYQCLHRNTINTTKVYAPAMIISIGGI